MKELKFQKDGEQNLKFEKSGGLLPAIVQDYRTSTILMLGYMNEEALQKTIEIQKVTFFSRSKNRLWTKGETSGDFLNLKEIIVDCDGDTLLIKAEPVGKVCHLGQDTCFGENNLKNSKDFSEGVGFLSELESIIKDRKQNPNPDSYVSNLFKKGINKVAQKVGEEATEVVIEAKDQNDDLFKNESADLLFHLLILLEAKNISLSEVVDVLKSRHKN
jgi:phosphoribosyl-ATP pyrophosphohydrolase/phosphoribosyl-AMP cyclohydrolase